MTTKTESMGASPAAPTTPRKGDEAATVPNPAPVPTAAGGEPGSRVVDAEAELETEESFEARYEMRTKLGEGGMGEVLLCKDLRIGREVALKVIRAEHGARGDLRKRFLREVRVQGQLEHPSIVPVYDLGKDPQRKAYFTMKRVRGQTLEQILSALRRDDPDALRQHTRFKLLTAFGTACLAVHFAHSRGVLHRDLKPGNVMLGDFGEVYVLDWGLAKVTDDNAAGTPDDSSSVSLPASGAQSDLPAGITGTGVLMGTPGYMAPEQIRGEFGPIGPGVDVYALGAILFELLALQPLHGRGTSNELMKSTLAGVDVDAAIRRAERDVPPELVAIVKRATARRPENRFPTAGQMQEALERFLNGDRDLERRRELAREHAGRAYDAAMRALEGEHIPGQGSRAAAEMTEAMREVNRAIALDPQNGDALRTLVQLMTQVPRALPASAQREIAAQARSWQRIGSRAAGFAYLSFFLLSAPLGYVMGLRTWPMAVLPELLGLAASALSFHSYRNPDPKGQVRYSLLIVSNLAIASTAWTFGPFVLVPALAAVNALSFIVAADRSRRGPAIFLGCCAILLPLVLEWTGVNVPSYAFEGGRLVVLPRALWFPEKPTLVFLLVMNVALLVTAALFVGRFKDALTATENRLYMQTWYLRQLVPDEAQASIIPPPGSSGAREE